MFKICNYLNVYFLKYIIAPLLGWEIARYLSVVALFLFPFFINTYNADEYKKGMIKNIVIL
jgi:hypothetical protein